MRLSNQTRKILKWLVSGLAIVVVLMIIAFFVCRSGKSGPKIDIQFNMKGPNNFNRKADVYLSKDVLNGITIEEFLTKVLDNSRINIPWKNVYIMWKSININGKAIVINDGHINNPSKLLINILGSIPEKISFQTEFTHTCSQEEIDKVQGTCDPCKGQKAVCPSDGSSGPVCKDWQYCPDKKELEKCCSTNPNGPYTTCDPKTNKITCGPCPEKDKPDCGKPGCKGIGPMCTSTGWVCAPGMVCPTGDELASCCTGPTDFASCRDGHIICSPCKGEPPECKESCCGHGLVCGDDGEWKCQPGVRCPSETVMKTCCDDSGDCKTNDPTKPQPSCDPDAPIGSVKVICENCGEKPSREDCPCSCEGNDWVCTENGWKCQPGQSCPITDSSCDISKLDCCKDGYTPYCTDENCVNCNCPEGTTNCGAGGSCKAGSQNPSICCEKGQNCSQNPVTKQWMCCNQGQQACDHGCCPNETICVNGTCKAKCGVDEDGKSFACGDNEECVMISPITQEQATKISGARYDPKTQTAYLCQQTNSVCQFDTDEPNFNPDSIGGYYPCYAYPSPDESQDGAGYCAAKIAKPGQQCTDPLNANTPDCFKNRTKQDCQKAEKEDGKCEWRDVLSYIASGTDSVDTRNKTEQITCDMGYIQNNWHGNFCYPGDEAFQRIVTFTSDKDKCSWQECVSQLAQPGVIDIQYNPNTGNCVGLLSCNEAAGDGFTNKIVKESNCNDDGCTPINNPNILPSSKPGGDTNFPQCSQDKTCDLGLENNNFTCDISTGLIEYPSVWMPKGKGSNTKCIELKNPPPSLKDEPRTRELCYHKTCKTGISDGSDDSCCLDGWYFDDKTSKCYTPQPKPSANYSGGPDNLGKCNYGGGCSGWPHMCGDTYYTHCHGHHAFGGCHGPNCMSGIGYGTDGTTSPNDNNPHVMSGKFSDDIPYCICNGSEWVDFSSGTYEVDYGSNYACSIGQKDDKCSLTY